MGGLVPTRVEPVSDRNEESPFGGSRRNRRKPAPPRPAEEVEDVTTTDLDEPKPELDEIA